MEKMYLGIGQERNHRAQFRRLFVGHRWLPALDNDINKSIFLWLNQELQELGNPLSEE